MTDSSSSRQQYIDFLLKKFSSMEESIKQIEQRCDEYGKLSEECRVAQKADIDHLKDWMMNQKWRDGVLHTAMNSVKNDIEAQDEKIKAGNTEQQSIIDSLRSEIEHLRQLATSSASDEGPHDDSVLGKIQHLEKKLEELSEKFPSGFSYSGDIENVLQKMAEYMLNENEKNVELRQQFEELRMTLGGHNAFEATLTHIDTIRSGLTEIQLQSQNDFAHQDKFNADVITDLNKLGDCLKELCNMQRIFETEVKQNCCGECEEMRRIRECLMNQVLMNRELQMETIAVKEEIGIQHQESEALKIKQELFNKSLSLQLKSVRDNVQEFGNDAAAEVFELRFELNQLKEEHEIQKKKMEAQNAEKQHMLRSFKSEIDNVREVQSQLGKHLSEELGKLSAGLATEVADGLGDVSSPHSPFAIAPKPSEDLAASQTDHHEDTVKPSENISTNSVSFEDTVKELVEAALLPYREEMSMLYKKVGKMSAELNEMKQKHAKKFKGIGRLNAKILSLLSTPEKQEESLLDTSNN